MAVCSLDTYYQCSRFECLFAVPKKKYPVTSMTKLKFFKELGSKLVKPAIKTKAILPRTRLSIILKSIEG